MLAHPTNPDLALNLPHLEEKKIQHEVVIMDVEKIKVLLYYQSDNSEDNGHQVKKFKSAKKLCTPEQIFCKYFLAFNVIRLGLSSPHHQFYHCCSATYRPIMLKSSWLLVLSSRQVVMYYTPGHFFAKK